VKAARRGFQRNKTKTKVKFYRHLLTLM